MKKSNFWQDACKYGALLGFAEILFMLLNLLVANWAVTLLCLAAFVVLIVWFARLRGRSLPAGEEYGYGRALGFIVVISLFAGVLCGVYDVFARNIFFFDRYQEALNQSLGMMQGMKSQFASSGIDAGDLGQMTRTVMYSPFWIIFGNVLGMFIKGGFFGLFAAALARRESSPFDDNDLR